MPQFLVSQKKLKIRVSKCGTIPGVLVALWILLRQHATQSIVPTPVLALGAVLLMVLVAVCAAIPALRASSGMLVADVLRAE